MATIAEETGIQKASLYHWFASKEDLLFQVLSGAVDALVVDARAVALNPALDFATKLRQMVALHANYTVSHRDVMQVFYGEAKWLTGERGRQIREVRRSYHQIYVDLFREARASGAIVVGEKVVPVYINSLFAMANELSQWYRDEGPFSPTEVGNLMSGLVLGAVLPRH